MNTCLGEKISVCLLTYNHVELIESTLRSILDQTITDYEVIVSDDSSTDGSWERIVDLAAQDARIRPIRTPHNMGMAGNANFAVAQSTRPYIALLHHDDLYREDLLEKWSSTLDSYPSAGFVFNPYGAFGSAHVSEESMPGPLINGNWLLEKHLLAHWGCAIHGTAMIRRNAWTDVGGMREEFGLLADIDLWMRLARHWSVGYVPEPVIVIRQQRPSYYPDIYKNSHWSWRRQQFLYEIHARNRQEYYDLKSIYGRLQWGAFRLRLNLDIGKWLLYAVIKKRQDMIASCCESETPYDFWPIRVLRSTLLRNSLNKASATR